MTATRAGGRHGRPWRAAGAAVVVLLAMAGAGMIGASMKTPGPRPPQPLAQAGPTTNGAGEGSTVGLGLPRSAPTTISIPRIGVNAPVMSLGTNPDGTVQVPPIEQADRAGWYEPGASPGEIGNAVIVGHVDSAATGPAVFFQLGALQPGDTITVHRQDGQEVAFTVDSVASHPKASFPTELVYGPSDKASLRVVTCGGQFDEAAHSYVNNVIVFATKAR